MLLISFQLYSDWTLMLDMAFHLRLCPVCAARVSDVHLIAASFSFGVEHSHWSLKELFPLHSKNSAPPLMRPLGFSFDIKEDG